MMEVMGSHRRSWEMVVSRNQKVSQKWHRMVGDSERQQGNEASSGLVLLQMIEQNFIHGTHHEQKLEVIQKDIEKK